MEVTRSIRVHLPDRPGALSSISTALAVHDVNIARLHVVSHEGPVVIDDLDLTAGSERDIDRAIGGFYPDVRVEMFDSTLGDPTLSVAEGLAAIATAATDESAQLAMAGWVLSIVRADAAALLSVTESDVTHAAGAPLAELAAIEAAAVREAVEFGKPVTLAMGEATSALPFIGFTSSRAAIAQVGPTRAIAVARRSPVPFVSGELDRLAAFAKSAGCILALK
jgi:hypothetical protein